MAKIVLFPMRQTSVGHNLSMQRTEAITINEAVTDSTVEHLSWCTCTSKRQEVRGSSSATKSGGQVAMMFDLRGLEAVKMGGFT